MKLVALLLSLVGRPLPVPALSGERGDPEMNADAFPELYGGWCYRPSSAPPGAVPAPEREATMCDPSTYISPSR